MDGGAGENTVKTVVKGIRLLKSKCRHLVVVTNEVFSESVSDSPEMTVYKKNLAQINRALAEMADRMTEVIYGIPVYAKGEQTPEEETKQGICFQIETDLKKESEEMKTMNFYIQWNGKEFCQADIVEQIQKQWEAMGNTAESLEKLNIYLKPEESRAYYVANESVQGCVEL